MLGFSRTLIVTVCICFAASCAPSEFESARAAQTASAPSSYPSLQIGALTDSTSSVVSPEVRNAVSRSLARRLQELGFGIGAAQRQPELALTASVLSCGAQDAARAVPGCVIAVTVTARAANHVLTRFAVDTPTLQGPATAGSNADAAARAIAAELAAEIAPVPAAAATENEDITAGGAHIVYRGNGVFAVSAIVGGTTADTIIDLKHLRHAYDPAVDKDVATYTNIILNDVVPRMTDESGRDYAQITLYQIDPPLVSQPSKEPGIYRGTDFRDPSNLVKGAYTNYVSPVFTNDRERRRVASHPIGHFYVKVEIPGYPTVLTGMTTIARADTELADLTIGRELGIGGVLLTPEPGRLNLATEALEELTLRQRELRVVDGLYFKSFLGRNTGPEYVIGNGNVVFARFKVPLKNAKDAMAFFVEFLARGEQNTFGSLLNRPERGTGSGCTPFAVSWLEAAGVIPFIGDPADDAASDQAGAEAFGASDFWRYLHRTVYIPWAQIGCDERLGVGRVVPAQYTIYDLLFHNLSSVFVREASEGLADKIKRDYGFVSGTLFQFGALTPLRDLIVSSKRKDPRDRGDYAWGKTGEGLKVSFWDNARFSSWVKSFRDHARDKGIVTIAQDGRFDGITFDAMNTSRQMQPFFTEAERISGMKQQLARAGARPQTCEAVFDLDIQ